MERDHLPLVLDASGPGGTALQNQEYFERLATLENGLRPNCEKRTGKSLRREP